MSRGDSGETFLWKMGGYALLVIGHMALTSMGACSVETARFNNAIKSEGLVDAKRGGYDYFECGSGDWWVSKVSATRPGENPQKVSGTVCCGIMKGCTIRWR